MDTGRPFPLATEPGTGGRHPRPQLVRSTWQELDGPWGFAFDDACAGLAAHWERAQEPFTAQITVPFPPESPASGIADTGYHPVCWYRRTIDQASIDALRGDGERVWLRFGAVDYRAVVWVDGQRVGEHVGGQTPFGFDITDALDPAAAEHVVVVRAEDDPLDVEMPRGKQDWQPQPHTIWYHRTSGIWQTVWLEAVPALHITRLAWHTDVPAATVTGHVRLSHRPTAPVWIDVELRLGAEVLAAGRARTVSDHAAITLTIEESRNGQHYENLLWSPQSPTLIDAIVSVRADLAASGMASTSSAPNAAAAQPSDAIDTVTSYLGMRSVAVDDGKLLLNDRPFELRSVLEQGYWPQSHLAAPSTKALRDEVELILSLGFNSVRVHQKVEDPRFLYWCDRLGLTVWGECAAPYEFSPESVHRLTVEWPDIVRRDLSHPSIITWVPLNESWGVQHIAHDPAQQAFSRSLADLTRALDPSRPVISNDGWEHTCSDLVTIHDYTDDPDLITERYATDDAALKIVAGMGPAGRRMLVSELGADRAALLTAPVLLTEFGGIRFAPGAPADAWGYSDAHDAADYEARLTALVGAVRSCAPLAGFCFTQLTDTRQEANGLCDDNRVPKLPVDTLRRIFG